MKESEEMHLKSTINESTLSTADAVPLPQGGRLREGGFAAKKEANPPALWASSFRRKGIDGFHHSPSFLRKEVPRRGGGGLPLRMEKEWEEAFPPFVILPCKTSGIHSV